jgi:hypothetical protein
VWLSRSFTDRRPALSSAVFAALVLVLGVEVPDRVCVSREWQMKWQMEGLGWWISRSADADFVFRKLEATPRIELGMEVLQTSALPLGYVALGPKWILPSAYLAAGLRPSPASRAARTWRDLPTGEWWGG